MHLYKIERDRVSGNEPWDLWSSTKPPIADPNWENAAKLHGYIRVRKIHVPIWSPRQMAHFLNNEISENPLCLSTETLWERP